MTTTVTIEIEVDDEYADPEHDTGMTEQGCEVLMDAVGRVGVISDGPTLVSSR